MPPTYIRYVVFADHLTDLWSQTEGLQGAALRKTSNRMAQLYADNLEISLDTLYPGAQLDIEIEYGKAGVGSGPVVCTEDGLREEQLEAEIQEVANRVLDQLCHPPSLPRACRVCGCTEHDCSGCIQRTGSPCYWIAEDLCSACEDPAGSIETELSAADRQALYSYEVGEVAEWAP